jgi:hypothetical protein
MVSLPLLCTTTASFALVATSAFTYCWLAGGIADFPDPNIVRMAAMVVGEVEVTIQYSVFTVPSPSWYTTV